VHIITVLIGACLIHILSILRTRDSPPKNYIPAASAAKPALQLFIFVSIVDDSQLDMILQHILCHVSEIPGVRYTSILANLLAVPLLIESKFRASIETTEQSSAHKSLVIPVPREEMASKCIRTRRGSLSLQQEGRNQHLQPR